MSGFSGTSRSLVFRFEGAKIVWPIMKPSWAIKKAWGLGFGQFWRGAQPFQALNKLRPWAPACQKRKFVSEIVGLFMRFCDDIGYWGNQRKKIIIEIEDDSLLNSFSK